MTIPTSLLKQLEPLAKTYGCDVGELVIVAVEEMVAAHATPPDAPTKSKRACRDCGGPITGSGPKKVCDGCKAKAQTETKVQSGESLMDARRRLDAEVVWNGTMSRQGKSISGKAA